MEAVKREIYFQETLFVIGVMLCRVEQCTLELRRQGEPEHGAHWGIMKCHHYLLYVLIYINITFYNSGRYTTDVIYRREYDKV